jgi:hypothetical protein
LVKTAYQNLCRFVQKLQLLRIFDRQKTRCFRQSVGSGPEALPAILRARGSNMRKLFFVDREMCGGTNLPPEFDLEDFCEALQGKVSDIEILPADSFSIIGNRDDRLVDRHLMEEALGEYCPK